MSKKKIILIILITVCILTAGIFLFFHISRGVKESNAEKYLTGEYDLINTVSFLHRKNSNGRSHTIAVIDIKDSMDESDKDGLESYLRESIDEKIYIIYE